MLRLDVPQGNWHSHFDVELQKHVYDNPGQLRKNYM